MSDTPCLDVWPRYRRRLTEQQCQALTDLGAALLIERMSRRPEFPHEVEPDLVGRSIKRCAALGVQPELVREVLDHDQGRQRAAA